MAVPLAAKISSLHYIRFSYLSRHKKGPAQAGPFFAGWCGPSTHVDLRDNSVMNLSDPNFQLELAANIAVAGSILLAGRNNVHTWWLGIVGCALFAAVFERSHLYADMVLQ
ncbi:nicotinamide mononucleotide transporter, partial [Acinetobacter baumannii]|uniref:nicotinamide mononucleotide transporter n=1 Tax=Acinetobacter baumannii TaxID=470 RepID=UPI0020907F40